MPVKLNRKRGFTLLEMLVSIGLFLLVWVSLVGSIMVGKAVEVRGRHRIQATYAAQRAIEELRKYPFEEIKNGVINGVVPLDSGGLVTGTQTIAVTTFGNPYYKRVDVNITWQESAPAGGSATVSESLSTYIANNTQAN